MSHRAPSFRILASLLVFCVAAWSFQPPAIAETTTSSSAASAADDDTFDSDGDGDADRPDKISASLASRRLKRRVEDMSARTTDTRVFANPDGSWTTETAAGPVRSFDPSSGRWRSIDTSLHQVGDNWVPASAGAEMTFSNGGNSNLATVTGLKSKDFTFAWPTELPAPEVHDNTLIYKDVLPMGDLVLTVLPGGFSESVVLRGPPKDGLDQIPLMVDTDGAKLKVGDDGSVSVRSGGEALISAPTPLMWDADKSDTEAVDVSAQKAGGDTRLVLKPDVDFLRDPDTQYPVTIDPSFTVNGASSSWLVNPSNPNGSVNDPYVKVGSKDAGANEARSFLAFDTSSLSGKDVVSASLSLYAAESAVCSNADLRLDRVTQSWSSSTLKVSSQPAVSTTDGVSASQSAKGGPTNCAAQGRDTWDVTAMARSWAGGQPGYGVRLTANSPNSNSSWRTYYSPYYTGGGDVLPRLNVTWNQPPAAASTPTVSDSRTWASTLYTRNWLPAISTSATDPDLGQVSYAVEVYDVNGSPSTPVATCSTGLVSSGATSSCTPVVTTNPTSHLANGSFKARSRASDGHLSGPWSGWQAFTVNSTPPAQVQISCPNYAKDHWYENRPATTTSCTLRSSGAAQIEWTLNGATQSSLSTDGNGAAGTGSISVPNTGWTEIKARALSNAGLATDWTVYGFGTGPAGIVTPIEGASAAGSFTVRAGSVAGARSAHFEWRRTAGGDLTWHSAGQLYKKDGTAWDGTLLSSEGMSSTPELLWTPGTTAPQALQLRVVFDYDTGQEYEWDERISPVRTVQLSAHAANPDAPTADIGPGRVNLASGEFGYDATDVSIGGLTLGRSHLSEAAAAAGAAGIFGRGWTTDIDGGGPASFVVSDQRAATGSLLFTTSDGVSYTFHSTAPAASNLSGEFPAIGDAIGLGARVTLDAGSGVLTFTESDSTRTTFTQVSGQWRPTATIGTAASSTTTYLYNADGLPSRIIAPAPPGVTCTASSRPAGCTSLAFTYSTVQGAQRLSQVDYEAWDPKLGDADGDSGADGLPDADAGMATLAVAKYSYNTDGTLQSVWDPRAGDGASALKTTYEYAISGTKTRLSKITPPGLKPWQLNYDGDGALTTVTRPLDTSVGTGNAIWTVKYGLELNTEADGLPNMSPVLARAWGQDGLDAPNQAAAVFGPDRVPPTTPSADDWSYAKLFYWNADGRLSNTASFGADAWQITSYRYDDVGNTIWELSPEGKRLALAEGGGNQATSAAAANKYATITLYNDTGTHVKATYGPMRTAQRANTPDTLLRPVTRYVYDDEAAASDMPGRPTTNVPAGGYNLVIDQTTSVTNQEQPDDWAVSSLPSPPAKGFSVWDTQLTRYEYDPVSTGDGDGWTLRDPTRTKLKTGESNGVATWDTTVTRRNPAGHIIQSRTPQGVADNDQARWTTTVYYSADTSAARAECRNNPQWSGLPCWTGPQAQPGSGSPIPTSSFSGYAIDGAATRTVQTSGTATKTAVVTYDVAGRQTRNTIATSGLTTADAAVPAVTHAYSATTGLPTTVSNGATTLTTGYDSWGRIISQTDGAGSTSTTTYNPAGRIATFSDGKGTYSYGYNETIAISSTVKERRGLATTVNTGISGYGSSIKGQYDTNGNLKVASTSLNGNWLSDTTEHAIDGSVRSRSVLADGEGGGSLVSSAVYQATGQLLGLYEPGRRSGYSYDTRNRLTKVVDDRGSGMCDTRMYSWTVDSNRTRTESHPAEGEGGYCADYTPASTRTATFDQADRITNAGYTYDQLGRTRTVPAADSSAPSGGNVGVGFYANDMVASTSQSVGGVTSAQSFTLDPLGRISKTTFLTNGVSLKEITNHYASTGDSPAWIETRTRANASAAWSSTWTRYVMGLDGSLAIVQQSSGSVRMPTYNAHGDIISAFSPAAGIWDGISYQTEFGAAPPSGTSPYGWLGSAQRDSASAAGGLVLMGARLYNPATGRFLSRDPIPGGNDNPYVYPPDPVNGSDTSGMGPELVLAPLIELLAAGLIAAAIAIVIALQLRSVKVNGYTVPLPSTKATSFIRHMFTWYWVYEIYYKTRNTEETFKYGITRVGPSRPASQLGTCGAVMQAKYGGPGECKWRELAYVEGWFNARMEEAALCTQYILRRGHPPYGMLKCL